MSEDNWISLSEVGSQLEVEMNLGAPDTSSRRYRHRLRNGAGDSYEEWRFGRGPDEEKTDADFERRLAHYYEFMGRFIDVHRRQAAPVQAEMLIELKRTEQWEKSMGDYAAVCTAPEISKIEQRMQGLADD